ncbi:MAG: ATP-binding cassette domain-containing protein [Streptosporangiales bacterium]|nr:ATP-binding cassette domain-containing protein [Streptosporangiales bacterium]
MSDDASAVAVRGLTKTFRSNKREVTVLDGIDLTVEQGELLVILGASGCGKTTLLNIVAGFEEPTAGTVEALGEPVRAPGPDRVMVFQQYALFPWMTVIDNVAFGLRLAGVPRAERREIARRHIAMVNLEGFEDAYIKELSGGMKQRIAIARGLATDPQVLLMDEPFAAVDAMTRSMLQTELVDLHTRTHKTILFITHSVDEALLLSTRILVMSSRPGRVLELIDNPLPRPRTQDLMASQEFQELRRRVWHAVENEVRKTSGLPVASE